MFHSCRPTSLKRLRSAALPPLSYLESVNDGFIWDFTYLLWHEHTEREKKRSLLLDFSIVFNISNIHFCISFPSPSLLCCYTAFVTEKVASACPYILFAVNVSYFQNNYGNQPIFSLKNIHSIVAAENLLMLWGGPTLSLITLLLLHYIEYLDFTVHIFLPKFRLLENRSLVPGSKRSRTGL